MSLLSGLYAQDKKIAMLYKIKSYCKCINRYDKLSSKEKSSIDLYYKAASYYQLYLNKDFDCDTKDPFSKSVRSIARLKKQKDVSSVRELPELIKNVFNSGLDIYRQNMADKKYDKALQIIELLKEIETTPVLLMAQSYAECQKGGALSSFWAFKALQDYKQIKEENDNQKFIEFTNLILLKLDSIKSPDLQPLMDTVMSVVPDNDKLANTFYGFWKRDIIKYKDNKDYGHLFNTIDIILKHYPDRQVWKDEVIQIVLSIADSMVTNFNNDSNMINGIFYCSNFLTKARNSVPEDMRAKLFNAAFYSIPTTADKYKFAYVNSSTSFNNILRVEADRKYKADIYFEAIVPKEEMMKIKDFIWQDAPDKKKARSAKDFVRKENMNYFLLDSLCHYYCNIFRQENSKSALLWNRDLYRASKHHASTMACIGSIFHGEEEDLLYGQIDSVKMYRSFTDLSYFRCSGENALYNFAAGKKITYDELAQTTIQQWKDSPGHRANMLDEKYLNESISISISGYFGQSAVFTDSQLFSNYFPEIKKLIEIFPLLKNEIIRPKIICFASQNFACK